ncbi:MAG: helix-turn-helix transcriptional regulator [Bacteroidia bacterium]|nr:helix-turn-helix transcriptional regulator [Bacteroidia bacterium]
MVSMRCKLFVADVLEMLSIPYLAINLGEVILARKLAKQESEKLNLELKRRGLELMDKKKSILIEKIKTVVIEMVHYSDDPPKVNFSDYLSEKIKLNYAYLANLFSETEGITIEHFIILHKIERVKELIIYDELNLSEIAWKMHYSSAAHLSSQFKKVTGLTPTYFKSLKNKRRKLLEDV